MLFSALLSMVLLPPCAAQQTPREYVIREVIPPRFKDKRYKFDWNFYWFSGDSDGNGEEDFMLQGTWEADMYTTNLLPEYYFEFHTGAHFENNRPFQDHFRKYYLSSGRWTLLETPSGFQAIIARNNLYGGGMVAIDWDTGIEIGNVDPPTGFPNGIPDPSYIAALYNAGDQNGDGYEDFFWSIDLLTSIGFVSYWGLYDGATLQSIWQKASAISGTGPLYGPYSGILQDMNGDGLLDYLVAIPQLNQVTWVQTHSYIAQSGPDGAVLWREDDLKNTAGEYAFTEALTGDGIPDPIFFEYENNSPNSEP